MNKFLKITTIITILIVSLTVFSDKLYAVSEGYQFTCFYNDFKFEENGKSFKIQVDVYDTEIKVFNIVESESSKIESGDFLNSHEITLNSEINSAIHFSKKTDSFYSDGKAFCPIATIDHTLPDSLTLSFDRIDINPNLKIENNPKRELPEKLGASKEEQEKFEEENSDEILLDCNDNGEDPYYYEPGSYNNGESIFGNERGKIVFEYQLSFNIIKYKSGKVKIKTNYGSQKNTIYYDVNNKTGSSNLSINSQYSISFLDLGSLESCPEIYFCYYGGDLYTFTANKTNCLYEEQASKTVDKETAENTGLKFQTINPGAGIGGGKFNCKDLLNENLIEFIKKVFTIVKVIAILIAITLGIIDFVNAASKEKDELMIAVKKASIRLTLTILVLLLPTIIEIVGKLLGRSDILCGIK